MVKNDTSSLYENCSKKYKKLLTESLKITEADNWFLNKEKRGTALEKSQEISQKATECFQRNRRFEDQPENWNQWTITASVTLGHVLMPLVFTFIVWMLVLVRKYKAGILDTDARWMNILEDWTYDNVGKPIKDKVGDHVQENCCCMIFCLCSCTWICYLFCPGKIQHFFLKCFHAIGKKIGQLLSWCFHVIGRFLSLFLSLPLVPVNKMVEGFWQIRLYFNEKAKREATEGEKNDPIESERKTDDDYIQEYKQEKERLANKLDNNTSQGKGMKLSKIKTIKHMEFFICRFTPLPLQKQKYKIIFTKIPVSISFLYSCSSHCSALVTHQSNCCSYFLSILQ